MSASLRASVLAAATLSIAPGAVAQGHAHRPASQAPQPFSGARITWRLPAPASVLWIGAHPDDEVLAAPLLARWCRDGRARCSLLTATRGGDGPCLLSGGCAPDLATVRSAEAGASSQYFGANAILLSWPDGGGMRPPPWDPGAGGSREAVATIAGFIRAEAPDVVLTFDPRHGTTCHPDHRAIAAVVLEAVGLVAAPPEVFLLESRLRIDADPFAIQFLPATSEGIRFDATTPLAATGAPAWNAVEADMERHPSQFDGVWLAAVRDAPPTQRAVFLAPAPWILTRPVSGCP